MLTRAGVRRGRPAYQSPAPVAACYRDTDMTPLATDSHAWIQDVCRRFSDVVGWTLSFVPANAENARAVEQSLKRDAACCWHCRVADSEQPIGFLRADRPAGADDRNSALAVSDFAGIIGELVNTISTAKQALRSRTQEVNTLVDIGRSLPHQENLLDAINQLLRAAVELTGLRTAGFLLLDRSTQKLKLRASAHLDTAQFPFAERGRESGSPDSKALGNERVLIKRGDDPDAVIWLPNDATMGICLPVRSEFGPIGTIWGFDRRRRNPDLAEWQILESIASQLAAVLERAVLRRESAVQHRIRRDLEIASRCHPDNGPIQHSAESWFEVAAQCSSRYEIGGDLCELIPLDSRRSVIVVGDASGDSVPAAIVASAVRGALATLMIDSRAEFSRTDLIMQRLNQSLHLVTPTHQFMSLILGVLDADDRTLTYTNAGHPAPIFSVGGRIRALASHGMLLGVTPDATYERTTVELKDGNVLVAFTDGVSEAMNPNRRMFRADGIIAEVQRAKDASAESLLNAIWARLESHLQGGSQPDDRTLLVVKVRN